MQLLRINRIILKKNTIHTQAAASINTGFAAFLRLEEERKFELKRHKICVIHCFVISLSY